MVCFGVLSRRLFFTLRIAVLVRLQSLFEFLEVHVPLVNGHILFDQTQQLVLVLRQHTSDSFDDGQILVRQFHPVEVACANSSQRIKGRGDEVDYQRTHSFQFITIFLNCKAANDVVGIVGAQTHKVDSVLVNRVEHHQLCLTRVQRYNKRRVS